MKKTKKALASLAIAGMALTMIPFNAFAADTVSTRLAGNTAVQTSQAIAKDGWTTSLNAVIAPATAYNMVDALAAAPLAAALNAPVLLTGGDQLSAEAKAEITRLGVKTVYATSGLAVIKAGVIADLQGMGVTVVNLGGFDQYETSVNIAKEIAKVSPTTSIFIANGEAAQVAQDALSVAAIAGAQKQPLLLTQKGQLPKVVADYIDSIKANVTTSYITGGTGVVSDAVKAQLPGTVYRNAGNDAYDTNLEVLKNFTTLDYTRLFVANGETMIDALAGAPLAAQTKSPVVLVNATVKTATTDYLKTKLTAATVVTALGGTAVVPENLRTAIANPGQLNVKNVAGTTDSVYADKSGQTLKLSVDGAKKTVAELKTAGYSVEFQASQDVFVGGEDTSADGVVSAHLDTGDSPFTYTVVISKGDTVVATSSSKRVTIEEESDGTSVIDSVKIYLENETEVESGKIAKQDEGVYVIVKGTIEGEDTNEEITDEVTFSTSDASIAWVSDSDGMLQLGGALGSVTITVKTTSGETMTKTFTVVDGEREVSKSNTKLTTSSVKIGKSVTKDIGITVKDQYGDPIEGYDVTFNNEAVVENSDGDTIAEASVATTDEDGEAIITIVATDETGSGTLTIKGSEDAEEDGVTLGSVSINVGSVTNVTPSKYELRNAIFSDSEIDVSPEEDDNVTRLHLTTLNSSGYEIANVDFADDTYTLKLDNKTTTNDYVDAEFEGEDIVVTGKKAGTVKLSIYEGSQLRASETIKVVDSRAQITGVTFATNVPSVESIDSYSLDNVLEESGIKTDGKAVFFEVPDTDNTFDIKTADDSIVGRVKLSVVQGKLTAMFNEDNDIEVTPVDDYASGKILISVYKIGGMDNDIETFVSSKTINVDEIAN